MTNKTRTRITQIFAILAILGLVIGSASSLLALF
jgi:hypothetical protein